MGFFEKLKQGLKKTKESLFGGLGALFSSSEINDDFYDELEETLILADIGAKTSSDIVEGLRRRVKEQKLTEAADVRKVLKEMIGEMLGEDEHQYRQLFYGVHGSIPPVVRIVFSPYCSKLSRKKQERGEKNTFFNELPESSRKKGPEICELLLAFSRER